MVGAEDRETIKWVWEEPTDEWPQGYWRQPSREEYREQGHWKAKRPRGGGAKSEWFKEYAKMQRENPQMTKNEIIAELGPCPPNQTALKLARK